MSIGGGGVSTMLFRNSPTKSTPRSGGGGLQDVELGSPSPSNAEKRKGARARSNSKSDSFEDNNDQEKEPLVAEIKPPSTPRAGLEDGSSSVTKSIIASSMYSGCSVGMVLVNKSLASR